jgi:hypothetical protein
MKRTRTILVIVLAIIVVLVLTVHILGTHSGVTAAQISEALPGDKVIANPWISIDRAATLPVSAEVAWPWIQQLGKDRGGWYAPFWLEDVLHEHAASTTLQQFQHMNVGDVVPDWGGGSLKVLSLQQNQYVVYGSFHNGEATTTAQPYAFTWALVLENDTPTSTSFHIRLRLAKPNGGSAKLIPPSLPGLIDYATDVVMFDGLKERLR